MGSVHAGNTKTADWMGSVHAANTKTADWMGSVHAGNTKTADWMGSVHAGNTKNSLVWIPRTNHMRHVVWTISNYLPLTRLNLLHFSNEYCLWVHCVHTKAYRKTHIIESVRSCPSIYVNGQRRRTDIIGMQMQMSYRTYVRNFFKTLYDDTLEYVSHFQFARIIQSSYCLQTYLTLH